MSLNLDIGWKVIVLAISVGWLPLLVAELARRFSDNYEIVGFGLAWGLSAMPICTAFAGAILVFKLILFVRGKPSQ